jgi:uncharacterized protein with NAD-binding domain and iron-sulfur cluster
MYGLLLTVTAREIFKQYGCSQRLYKEVFEPAVQAGLFAPGEQSSAAATLAMLYYYILSHQVSTLTTNKVCAWQG